MKQSGCCLVRCNGSAIVASEVPTIERRVVASRAGLSAGVPGVVYCLAPPRQSNCEAPTASPRNSVSVPGRVLTKTRQIGQSAELAGEKETERNWSRRDRIQYRAALHCYAGPVHRLLARPTADERRTWGRCCNRYSESGSMKIPRLDEYSINKTSKTNLCQLGSNYINSVVLSVNDK